MIERLIVWFAGLVISVLIGNFLVRITIKKIRNEKPAPLSLHLGFLEILSYAIAYIIGFPGFIAIWLALKTAGRWTPNSKSPHITNSFLIGNLMAVFIGVYLGINFKKYLLYMGLIEVYKYFLS